MATSNICMAFPLILFLSVPGFHASLAARQPRGTFPAEAPPASDAPQLLSSSFAPIAATEAPPEITTDSLIPHNPFHKTLFPKPKRFPGHRHHLIPDMPIPTLNPKMPFPQPNLPLSPVPTVPISNHPNPPVPQPYVPETPPTGPSVPKIPRVPTVTPPPPPSN